MFNGTLSHKLINCTHCGDFITDELCFLPGHTFDSPTPSYTVYKLYGPSTHDEKYFYKEGEETQPL